MDPINQSMNTLSTLYGPKSIGENKKRSHSFSPVISSKLSAPESANNRTVPAAKMNRVANNLSMQMSANISSVQAAANKSTAPAASTQSTLQPATRTLKKTRLKEERQYTLDEMCSNPDVIIKLTERYYKSLKYTGEVTQDPRIFDYLSDGIQ